MDSAEAFELFTTNDLHEVIVQVERSRIPFHAIPNIRRIDAGFRAFVIANSEREGVWSHLESHGVLRDAYQINWSNPDGAYGDPEEGKSTGLGVPLK